MLDLQLPQSLGSGQGSLEPVDAAIEVVPRLVKDFLSLENTQDTVLTFQNLFGEEEVRQSLHRDLGLLPLCRDKVGPLGRRGFQFFHPLRNRRHFDRLMLA